MRIFVDGAALIDAGITLGGTGVPNVPSIASTVRANPTAGFSIVSYTGNQTDGASVGHGLNSVPELILAKSRVDSTYEWITLHKTPSTSSGFSAGNLNTTDTILDISNGSRKCQSWHAAPTSSVFSLGIDGSSWNGTLNKSEAYIAYCFAPVEGYSAMGSYQGNGNADGPFVFTNFRPAFLLLKRTDSSSSWRLFDTERETHNVQDALLFPNESSAEAESGSYNTDILSNGFKLRTSSSHLNASGSTFIYLAFAENPFASNGGLAR